MFHILYKVTNKTNNKYYIGKHSTTNIDDGYMGSGLAITRALKKYGRESFEKEIISFHGSELDLNTAESELITADLIADSSCYNIALGGHGGVTVLYKGHPKYNETRAKISAGRKSGNYKPTVEHIEKWRDSRSGYTHSDETRAKISESHKEYRRNNYVKPRRPFTDEEKAIARARRLGVINSEETRRKISENHANAKGSNNPMFGRTQSEETRAKIRARALSRSPKSPEALEQIKQKAAETKARNRALRQVGDLETKRALS